MEWVHPVEVVQEQAEVPEWVVHEEEREVVRERVQVREENACAQSAERPLLIKQVRRATLSNAQNVVHR